MGRWEKVGECGFGRGKGNRPGPDDLESRSMWINRGNRGKEKPHSHLKKGEVAHKISFLFDNFQ